MYVFYLYAYIYIYVPHACLVPPKVKEEVGSLGADDMNGEFWELTWVICKSNSCFYPPSHLFSPSPGALKATFDEETPCKSVGKNTGNTYKQLSLLGPW